MEAVLAPPPPALTAADRCDGSSSEQALVLLKHPVRDSTLQLCAHHYAQSALSLISWEILVDDRPRTLGIDA